MMLKYLQEFQRASLLGRGTVVELGAVDLAREVQEDADFFLKRGYELGLGQDHERDDSVTRCAPSATP